MYLKGKGVNLITNPNKEAAKLNADVCLLSDPTELSLVNFGRVFDWPGEYEIKDIPLIAFQAWTEAKSKEDDKSKGAETLVFCFEMEDVKFCHLANVGHTLTSDMLNEIGDVDVLIIRFGGDSNLDGKKAMEIIEAIEPRIVIPMGEEAIISLKKEGGAENLEPIDKFVIKSSSDLPEDQMKYVVLSKAN